MSAITHRAAVARLKVMEADLRNLVKAIAEGRRLDAMVQMTLGEAAMLISCLEAPEAPDPVTANVHYQSARAAAEAATYDAFQRGGAEPPQPQPVTREEFDRVASRVTDVLTMTAATRAVIEEDRGRLDQLAATVGDIANTLGRERVVERLRELEKYIRSIDDGLSLLSMQCLGTRPHPAFDGWRKQFADVFSQLREHSELLASLNLPKLREECHALAAGGDLVARVARLEKLAEPTMACLDALKTDLDTWRQRVAAYAESRGELRGRIAKHGPAP